MGINIRQKGQNGEREVQQALEEIVRRVLVHCGQAVPEKAIVQRNQNQSAVGGSDLSNTFGLSIEIKRQEQLAINTWWKQCVTSAEESKEFPVLLYRQSRKPWKCVTWSDLPLFINGDMQPGIKVRVELAWEDFLQWFELWVHNMVKSGLYSAKQEMNFVKQH